MNTITPELLKAIVPTMALSKRTLYAPLIQAACVEFAINNEARVAAFIAQVAHESDHFNTLSEYASGAAYDHRADLGNTRPEAIAAAREHNTTAGRFYKGHGAIQTTGYYNHKKTGEALGVDAVNNPAILATPEYAFRSAGYFWHEHDLNKLADARQFKQITRVINGGFNGLASRVTFYERALSVLPDDFRLTADAEPPDPHAEPDVTSADAHAHDLGERVEGHAATIIAGDGAQALPVVSPDAPPVMVEATAVTKSGARKSIIATLTAALGTLGVGVESVYGKVAELIKSGNPTVALVIVALVAAGVLIYWKYQERQTRLDEMREQHAHETNKLAMTIAADQTRNTVELVPNKVPVESEG